MSQLIKNKKKLLENNSRLRQNNKYCINSVKNTNIAQAVDSHNTMMDHFMKILSGCVTNVTEYHQLYNFLSNEEFDSDAIQNDIMNDEFQSNILQRLANKKHIDEIKQFIYNFSALNKSFATGFLFYYWKHYNNPKQNTSEDTWNVNDHSGYTPTQLYVIKKYNSIKTEILNNKIFTLSIDEYKLSLIKATEYINKQIVKSMKSGLRDDVTLYYEIPNNTLLNISNLLSIILYTDWSKLCFEFSKTFRKNNLYESLSSVKYRNREYANWSRILRETVEYYAYDGYYYYEKQNKKIYPMTGPFYCGVSCVLVMPAINIRLCAPSSTSIHKEVAMNFGGESGMIIQLNNNGDIRSKCLRAFCCSWLSTYAEEGEWLFVGGNQRIKIESVINVRTCENFERFLKALFHLDCMTNGTAFHMTNTPSVSKNDCFILKTLINDQLNKEIDEYTCPKYINSMFTSFIQQQTQIVINLEQIEMYFKQLKDLIIETSVDKPTQSKTSKKSAMARKHWIKKTKIRRSHVFKNIVFKETLFRLFKNAKHVIIYSTDHNGWKEYKFNILSLLLLVDKTSRVICKVTIKAAHDDTDDKHSWIYKEFCKFSTIKAQNNIWNVAFAQTTDQIYSYTQDCLIIAKKSY
eukprot:447136_1